MKSFYNCNVTETEYGAHFDEYFNMSNFSIHFDLDTEAENCPFGHVEFEPLKRLATMFYYGHPEDLSPSIFTYDLLDYPEGHALMAAFHTYDLGEVYRTAKSFTERVIKDLLDEQERLWREYVERA